MTLRELMAVLADVMSVRIPEEDRYFVGVKELGDMVRELGDRQVKQARPIYYGLIIHLA